MNDLFKVRRDSSDKDPIGTTIGKILIVSPLGRGGVGEVFIGYDLTLERNVAVKILKRSLRLNKDARERFILEAKALSKLEHPNICRIYDFIEGDDYDYLVMELIRGKRLSDVTESMSLSKKLLIAEQIAEVLLVAHGCNIVHRDLKPDNVLITDVGQVKVLDFGLARALENSQPAREVTDEIDTSDLMKTQGFLRTRHGIIMGTPVCMSPEQARGEHVSSSSDMYSFGLLLQELFTGKPPYPEDVTDLIDRAQKGKTESVTGIKSSLTSLINQLKSVNPENRPIAKDTLDRIRWIREEPKRRVKRVAAGTFVLLLVLGTALSGIGFFNAKQSEKRAVESESLALQEAETARQTVALLQEFLSSVDPAEKGRELQVIELVEAFKPRLDDLGDEPLIQASLYYTYGKTYNGLGEFDEAYTYSKMAWDLRKNALGEQHPEALVALIGLVRSLSNQGKYGEAEEHARQGLEISKRALGEEKPHTIDLQAAVALAVLRTGDYREAETLYRECLEVSKRVFGEEHRKTLRCLHGVAQALYHLGEFAESEKLNRRLLEARNRVLGEEDLGRLNTMLNLTAAIDSQGRNAEAEELLHQLLAESNHILGEDHPHTLRIMSSLAANVYRQDKYPEAEQVLRECLELQKEALGEGHPETIHSMFFLAETLRAQGKHHEAGALSRRVLETRTEVLGAEHPDTLSSMHNLALVLSSQGKGNEAVPLYRQASDAKARVLGEEHPSTLNSRRALALTLLRLERYTEAETAYRQLLKQSVLAFGEEHDETLKVMNNLAWTLTVQGEHLDEAEKLALACVSSSTRVHGSDHPVTAGRMDTLANVLEKRNKTEEAIQYYRKAARVGVKASQQALERLGWIAVETGAVKTGIQATEVEN